MRLRLFKAGGRATELARVLPRELRMNPGGPGQRNSETGVWPGRFCGNVSIVPLAGRG